MNPKKFPKNKFLRLIISITLVILVFQFSWKTESIWLIYDPLCRLFAKFDGDMNRCNFVFQNYNTKWFYLIHTLIFCLFPLRYIWFEKSRNRIFFGLFNFFKKFEPRIYSTTSNADELKKYAELRDKGIITEEEFQSKKRKLLDL